MEVLTTHLTRMRHPFICVAGVDRNDKHVRPVLAATGIGRVYLTAGGGPYSIGSVVRIDNPDPRPRAPHCEDVVFHPRDAAWSRQAEAADFVAALDRTAGADMTSIFGSEVEKLSATAAAVPGGKGRASLGVLHPSEIELTVERSGGEPRGLRLTLEDRYLGSLRLKVTDLRLWKEDHVSVDMDRVRKLASLLDDCFVTVGLTRAFEVSSYPGARHWVQVNNVHPVAEPYWAVE